MKPEYLNKTWAVNDVTGRTWVLVSDKMACKTIFWEFAQYYIENFGQMNDEQIFAIAEFVCFLRERN